MNKTIPSPAQSAALTRCLAIRSALLDEFPELSGDEGTLNDTLDGISDASEIVALVVRNALLDEAFADACAKREKEIKERRDRLKLRAQRGREIAAHMMGVLERTSVKLPDMTISVSPGQPKVIITDEEAIADDYKKVTVSLDLTRIKAAIQVGMPVDGAVLSNGQPYIRVTTR